MAVVIADDALVRTLDDMRQDTDELAGELCLFVNDYTPTTASVAGDFTEPTAGWYSRHDFSGGGSTWPAAGLDGSNNAESVHADIDWTHDGATGDEDIYGWFMVDGAGNLICAERYAGAPFAMDSIGKMFTVTPTVKLKRP